jgi:hypothetical protein
LPYVFNNIKNGRNLIRRQVLYPPELRARLILFYDPKPLTSATHPTVRPELLQNSPRDKIITRIALSCSFSFDVVLPFGATDEIVESYNDLEQPGLVVLKLGGEEFCTWGS